MSSSEDRSNRGSGKGGLVVVSGPSGTGKSSICDGLLERLPEATWSVSATTRPLRGQEVDGESYEFISEEEFARRREAGAFLESAEYCGHWYGTPRAPVAEAVDRGLIVIMEIDVQGGAQVAKAAPESIRVFVLPPDEEELRQRLEGRRTEDESARECRLAQAQREIRFAKESGAYTHFVVNDDLDRAVEEVIGIIRKEHIQT